ncbi:enterobactin/ferric enterobactin esterase [Listeria grayi]|uniref:Enterobactin/ferric enterobactin esterase n=1 Tax=Listeria grayi TaxID=1641 RepID=A0A378MBP7_LISGR|nr:esterase family protein [Listeria grayi]STY43789.1 enterobactin/ferric enterobactin esterase [Listeria grayi]
MAQGKWIDDKLYSEYLKEELDLIIYLPPDFSHLYKYPLFIVQDGKDYFQFGKLAHFSDELVEKDEMEKAIFIGVPYKTVTDRREKYHPEGSQNDAYVKFLARELLPYVENRFPSYQMAASRFLMGDSLGAAVSLQTALRYPHTFGNVILHSPFMDDSLLTAAKKADPAKLKIYHVIGSKETDVHTTDDQQADFLTPNLAFTKVLTAKGFEHRSQVFEGDHKWKYWQPLVKDALRYMLAENELDLESMHV